MYVSVETMEITVSDIFLSSYNTDVCICALHVDIYFQIYVQTDLLRLTSNYTQS
jgi:hypothetical protein